MNEGPRTSTTAVDCFDVAEGVCCMRLTGTIGHVHVPAILSAVERGVHSGQYRAFLLDCASLDALEPGVSGRVIAHCAANGLRFPSTVVVSKSAGIIAVVRAATVVLKQRRVEIVGTRGEAFARIGAIVAQSRPTPARGGRRVRQQSGEQPMPVTDAHSAPSAIESAPVDPASARRVG